MDWAETIGQGLHYLSMTNKKAGIVLILEAQKDRKFWIRLNTTIEHFNLPIDTWSIENTEYYQDNRPIFPICESFNN
jgi:hypothetical protein